MGAEARACLTEVIVTHWRPKEEEEEEKRRRRKPAEQRGREEKEDREDADKHLLF